MGKFIIKVDVATQFKKYNAILEALVNTSQYVKDDKNQPAVYNDNQTVKVMLNHVLDALRNTTYTRRNTRTQLDIGYRLVYITNGKDYSTYEDGTIDSIEVRGIQSDKVALRYSIVSVTQ